jgi:hypothetical protein
MNFAMGVAQHIGISNIVLNRELFRRNLEDKLREDKCSNKNWLDLENLATRQDNLHKYKCYFCIRMHQIAGQHDLRVFQQPVCNLKELRVGEDILNHMYNFRRNSEFVHQNLDQTK